LLLFKFAVLVLDRRKATKARFHADLQPNEILAKPDGTYAPDVLQVAQTVASRNESEGNRYSPVFVFRPT
jgi:hypothetical protein